MSYWDILRMPQADMEFFFLRTVRHVKELNIQAHPERESQINIGG